MDFSLSDDQGLLQDSVRKFIKGDYTFEHRNNSIKNSSGLAPAIWQQFADLGWLALPFAEADGGLGGSLTDTMVLLEEFGKGLVVEPYIASIVLGGGFLKRANPEQKSRLLPSLMNGSLQMAVAIEEYERHFSLMNISTLAVEEGEGYVLHGKKSCVINGDKADVMVVLARSSGQVGDSTGLSAFLVDASAQGVSVRAHRTVDGQTAAEITLDGVYVGAAALLGVRDQAFELATTVLGEGILALGAEAVGALSVLLNDTIEYTKTRKQFGVAISSFQILRHRMADMYIALEQSRSLLLAATLKTLEGHHDATRAVHALKAQLGRGGRLIAQEAIQLHGGMGMTDELAVGHYFKRLTAIDGLFGNADDHIDAFART